MATQSTWPHSPPPLAGVCGFTVPRDAIRSTLTFLTTAAGPRLLVRAAFALAFALVFFHLPGGLVWVLHAFELLGYALELQAGSAHQHVNMLAVTPLSARSATDSLCSRRQLWQNEEGTCNGVFPWVSHCDS
jgi:hypothetical protein